MSSLSKAEAKRIYTNLMKGLPQFKEMETPKVIVSVMDHWKDEELSHFSSLDHIPVDVFISNCFYLYRRRPMRVNHQYFREELQTPRNPEARHFMKNVFCNEMDKYAKPITIGYV